MVAGETSEKVPPSASDPLRLVITLAAPPLPVPLVRLAAVIPLLNTTVPLVFVNVTVPVKVHIGPLQVLGESVPPEMANVPPAPVTVSENGDDRLPQPPILTHEIVPVLKVPVVNGFVIEPVSALVKLMLFANAAVGKATAKSVKSITRLIFVRAPKLVLGLPLNANREGSF